MATVYELDRFSNAHSVGDSPAARRPELIAEDLQAARTVPLVLMAPLLLSVLMAVITVLMCM